EYHSLGGVQQRGPPRTELMCSSRLPYGVHPVTNWSVRHCQTTPSQRELIIGVSLSMSWNGWCSGANPANGARSLPERIRNAANLASWGCGSLRTRTLSETSTSSGLQTRSLSSPARVSTPRWSRCSCTDRYLHTRGAHPDPRPWPLVEEAIRFSVGE